jgi:hypothetical protein
LSETTKNGGSAILSYSLDWDYGSGSTYVNLIGGTNDSLTLSYTKTGLTTGSTYKFRYRVKNIFGWSAYSSILSLTAAKIPSKP